LSMLLKSPYSSSLAKPAWWAHPLPQRVAAPIEFPIRQDPIAGTFSPPMVRSPLNF
jgi:hypothetical protein